MTTDTALVVGYVGGDRQALADIYDRYADRIHDFCLATVRDPGVAAAAFSDTFLVAARRVAELDDPSRLRSWLYAIARDQCLARFQPENGLTRKELVNLVRDSRARLDERDQETLDLHMRHDLDSEELAEVLGLSTADAYELVQRVRDRVERSLGVLLVARRGRDDCHALAAILRGWNGRFTLLMRRRVARHVDDCAGCERLRRGLLAPGGLASTLPFIAAPAALRAQAAHDLGSAPDDPPPPPPSREPDSWQADGFPTP